MQSAGCCQHIDECCADRRVMEFGCGGAVRRMHTALAACTILMPSETVPCLFGVSVPIAPTWLASSCLELQLLLADDAPAST